MTQNNIWMPYTQMQTAQPPLEVIKAEGAYLYLADGRKLVDGIASWWTACHGYQHPVLVDAVKTQAQKLSHVMLGGLVHPQVKTLSHRLAKLLPEPLNQVMYSESGSVAVEIALKMALQYWQQVGFPERERFLYLSGDYHGDTLFTMGLCDPENGMHRFLQSKVPQQVCINIPKTVEELKQLETYLDQNQHQLAGIVIEPLVQGAIGMHMYTAQQLKDLCELCQRYDILIIMDEIFTGFYRTGTLFAFEQAFITPDIVCLSKALTGGLLPLAATIAHDKIYRAFLSDSPDTALMHGTTFTGNALGCACANASLDLFEQLDYAAKTKAIQTHLTTTLFPLAKCEHVEEVRVCGAIGAIAFKPSFPLSMHAVQQKCIEAGVWLRPINNVLYTTPPLNIEYDLLAKITTTMVNIASNEPNPYPPSCATRSPAHTV